MTTPTHEGFYWAKWRIASPGTDDDGGGCGGADAEWEVVEVFDNNGEGDSSLRVSVAGVSRSQHITNFFWGPSVGAPPHE